ncbi:MAG: FecR family protein [Allomuricauda sp.]
MENHRITETDIWAYVSNNADLETMKRVELWKASDQYDPDLFQEITKIYSSTRQVVDNSNIQKAKESFFEKVSKPSSNKTTFSKEFLKYAAAISLLIFTAIYFFWNEGEKTTIRTAFGEQKEIQLPDGTKVWLNSSSSLSYNPDLPRNTYLEGEAFFEVVKNEKVPFTVDTHDALKVKVLGTSFNIKSYSQNAYTETVLVEGKVELSSPDFGEKIQMLPNDKVVFIKDDKRLIKSTVGIAQDFTSWRDGQYRFMDKSFKEIALDLEIQNNVKIQFQNDKIANSKFTGSFERETTVKEILETLQLTKSFKYHQSSDGIWVVE